MIESWLSRVSFGNIKSEIRKFGFKQEFPSNYHWSHFNHSPLRWAEIISPLFLKKNNNNNKAEAHRCKAMSLWLNDQLRLELCHLWEARHGVKELNSFFSDTLIEWKCPVISLPHISGWSFIIGNHHQWKTHQHETPKTNEITKGIKIS